MRLTGRPVSVQWRELESGGIVERLDADSRVYALAPVERRVLHERIEHRFDAMLAAGFVAELEALSAREDLHADLPSMRAVGYRQGLAYLAGRLDAEAFRKDAVTATRRLAKRQLTWLRNWPEATQLVADDATAHVERIVRDISQ